LKSKRVCTAFQQKDAFQIFYDWYRAKQIVDFVILTDVFQHWILHSNTHADVPTLYTGRHKKNGHRL